MYGWHRKDNMWSTSASQWEYGKDSANCVCIPSASEGEDPSPAVLVQVDATGKKTEVPYQPKGVFCGVIGNTIERKGAERSGEHGTERGSASANGENGTSTATSGKKGGASKDPVIDALRTLEASLGESAELKALRATLTATSSPRSLPLSTNGKKEVPPVRKYVPFFRSEKYATADSETILDSSLLTINIALAGRLSPNKAVLFPFGRTPAAEVGNYRTMTVKLEMTDDEGEKRRVQGEFTKESGKTTYYVIQLPVEKLQQYRLPWVFKGNFSLVS